jgi:UDPglucose 6-dehydrogenase
MPDKKFNKNILCIGAGYVGGPTMAVIAAKCPQYKITVTDINEEKIKAWQTENLPIYEPGLLEAVKKSRDRNLFFSADIEENIKKADIIFVSVNTPTKMYGIGAGKTADLQFWEKIARDIVRIADSDKIIVEKSTLPVRTAEAMERIFNGMNKKIHFDVISNPEFLAEGTAISDLENPDRILIGSRETESGQIAREKIVEIYANWVPRDKIITCDIWSSELSKLVANAFLAQRISSINSISALCEKTEADIAKVARAIGMDSRIGPKFLNASVGFGGSCFKKDILNLVYICEYYGLHEVAQYWENVVKINEYQEERFVQKMIQAMFNTIAHKRIALFGFAFKANTGDTRESPAIYITRKLAEECAHVVINDPKSLRNAAQDLRDIREYVEFETDPYKASQEAHAIAIMTEWELYKTLNYKEIYKRMGKPAFLFDGRNILDHQEIYEIGFNVYPIGKPALTHF